MAGSHFDGGPKVSYCDHEPERLRRKATTYQNQIDLETPALRGKADGVYSFESREEARAMADKVKATTWYRMAGELVQPDVKVKQMQSGRWGLWLEAHEAPGAHYRAKSGFC